MTSLVFLFHIILTIYLGSFLYISYQILFYFQSKFIFIKMLFYFTFIACLTIKIKNKYNILFLYQYIIFFVLGIYLGRKIFRTQILLKNTEIKGIIDQNIPKLLYILKLLIIPPISYFIYCKIKLIFFYFNHPHLKPKNEYELF